MSLYNWTQAASQPNPAQQLNPTPTPRIKTTSTPSAEPVTADDLALILKVSAGDEAPFLLALLTAARVWCENWTGRFFLTRTAELWMDFWPLDRVIEINACPLTTLTSVSTYDVDDVETVMDSDEYQVDIISEPARIVLKDGITVPTGLRTVNGIKVVFTAGYGASADDVPEAIKTAIRMMAAEVYLARGAQVDAAETFRRNSMAPRDALLLLEPYKVVR